MPLDLSSLGWDGSFQAHFEPYGRTGHHPARVSRVDRGVCTVLDPTGAQRVSIGGGVLAAAAHDPVRFPCAGDWVAVRCWPDDRTTVEAVLPRHTSVVRASAGAAPRPRCSRPMWTLPPSLPRWIPNPTSA